MVLKWREREHEDKDWLATRDTMNLNALQRCGLLKFYHTSNTREQVQLLKTLVHLWDHELGMFDLQGETLDLTAKDIYFITGLSHRGALVNMEGTS